MMNLTSIFLNKLGGYENFFENSDTLAKNYDKNFDEVFNNFKSNEINKTNKNEIVNNFQNKKDSFKKEKDKIQNKKNYENSEPKNINNNLENETINYKDDENICIETNKNDFKEEKLKDKPKALFFDENVLNNLSQILNVSNKEIIDSLVNLNLIIKDLSKPENLIEFTKDVLKINSNLELLSYDNIKNVMLDVEKIANSISYDEKINYGINFDDYENKSFKGVFLIENNGEYQDIESLLKQVNASVVEINNSLHNKNLFAKNNNILNFENLNDEKTQILNLDTNKLLNNQQNLISSFENNSFFEGFKNNDFNQNFNQNFSQIEDASLNTILQTNIIDDNISFKSKLDNVSILKNIDQNEIIKQINNSIKTSIKTDFSEIKLMLRPDFLGELSLKISTEKGVITAQFLVENQKVKEIIESNFNELKNILNEQGIQVSQLEVSVNDNQNKNSHSFNSFNFEQSKSSTRIKNIVDNAFKENEDEKQKNIIATDSLVNYSI